MSEPANSPSSCPSSTAVYRERAHFVALLACRYPSVIAYNDPDEPDWPIIYIRSPTGQMSWHISPADLDLFRHVRRVHSEDPAARWDGHTTDDKYQRLVNLIHREFCP